ncbi:MAG TPA: sigma-70 family RNA polymerase sigma factor [Blastocatellia bacterium]|nr:sigma-70 family RNA polymerase sigma factor [Blastocatellia bacterium]
MLLTLHSDRERAGEVYLLLWEKLLTYFQLRSCLMAEEMADETLTRVAKKIAIGEEPRNIAAYCYGFAKLVLLEYLKKPEFNRGAFEDLPAEAFVGVKQISQKERQQCFDRCLRQLPVEEAQVLIEYWCNEDRPLRDVRRDLAERLGLSPTALRIRVHRIKHKLEICTKKCLGEE